MNGMWFKVCGMGEKTVMEKLNYAKMPSVS